MSTITETLKAKLDELDLDRRLDELTRATEDAVKKAVAHAGDLAHDNREKVSALLDKASAVIDEKTDGKYRDQVTKVRTQVETGVDKLAAKRPGPVVSDATDEDWARATDEGMALTPEEVGHAAGMPAADVIAAQTSHTPMRDKVLGPRNAESVAPDAEADVPDAPTTWDAHTDKI